MKHKNIELFKEAVTYIHLYIEKAANLYYEDLKNNKAAEDYYIAQVPQFTKTLLRRLEDIAKGNTIPLVFYVGDDNTYKRLKSMSIEQQEKAMSGSLSIVSVVDDSHWNKKFDDLTSREQRMVYDSRAKTFRSLVGQKEWLINNPITHNKSSKGVLKPISVKKESKAPTKRKLITSLKKFDVNSDDLSKLASASVLMEAAQKALKLELSKPQ